MMRRLLRAAVRNAAITSGDGLTVRIDARILRAANILPLEEVDVVNHATGERYTAFAEVGAAGEVSAPRMRTGDVVSVLSWGVMHDGQTLGHSARVVTLGEGNEVVSIQEIAAV